MNDLHQPLRADIDVLIPWSNVKLKGAPAPLVLPTRAALYVLEYGHHDNIVLHAYTLNLLGETLFTRSPWMCSVPCWIPPPSMAFEAPRWLRRQEVSRG